MDGREPARRTREVGSCRLAGGRTATDFVRRAGFQPWRAVDTDGRLFRIRLLPVGLYIYNICNISKSGIEYHYLMPDLLNKGLFGQCVNYSLTHPLIIPADAGSLNPLCHLSVGYPFCKVASASDIGLSYDVQKG